jgi:hypothetical protein
VAADVGEEELQAVGGAGDRDSGCGGLGFGLGLGRLLGLFLRRLGVRRNRCGRRRLADLEPGALELARELLDLVVVQLELGREGVELDLVDEAALLGALDDGADLFRLEQFVQLVLRQGSLSPFGPASSTYQRALRTLGGKSSGYHPLPGAAYPDPRTRRARSLFRAPAGSSA